MCGGIHYGEVEGLVSVEKWSCSTFSLAHEFICSSFASPPVGMSCRW